MLPDFCKCAALVLLTSSNEMRNICSDFYSLALEIVIEKTIETVQRDVPSKSKENTPRAQALICAMIFIRVDWNGH